MPQRGRLCIWPLFCVVQAGQSPSSQMAHLSWCHWYPRLHNSWPMLIELECHQTWRNLSIWLVLKHWKVLWKNALKLILPLLLNGQEVQVQLTTMVYIILQVRLIMKLSNSAWSKPMPNTSASRSIWHCSHTGLVLLKRVCPVHLFCHSMSFCTYTAGGWTRFHTHWCKPVAHDTNLRYPSIAGAGRCLEQWVEGLVSDPTACSTFARCGVPLSPSLVWCSPIFTFCSRWKHVFLRPWALFDLGEWARKGVVPWYVYIYIY